MSHLNSQYSIAYIWWKSAIYYLFCPKHSDFVSIIIFWGIMLILKDFDIVWQWWLLLLLIYQYPFSNAYFIFWFPIFMLMPFLPNISVFIDQKAILAISYKVLFKELTKLQSQCPCLPYFLITLREENFANFWSSKMSIREN